MRRRQFIVCIVGAAAWPIAVRAEQSDRMRRIGVLMQVAESDSVFQGWLASFRDELAKLDWVEGSNLRIDYRWAGGDVTKLPAYAAELVALKPAAIFAATPASVAALHRATDTVPIVFANVNDPIAAGFISNVARPGGNITGFALPERAIYAKRVELLKQLAPGITRIVLIYDPANTTWSTTLAEVEAAGRSFGINASGASVHNAAEIDAAIQAFAREPNGGLIVMGSPSVVAHRDKIIALAARSGLPAVYAFSYFVAEGGLASYGVDNVEGFRGAALYIDRILKGAKPGDLPVQFATKFELIINMKTAKALGLDPPISLLARTDQVIE